MIKHSSLLRVLGLRVLLPLLAFASLLRGQPVEDEIPSTVLVHVTVTSNTYLDAVTIPASGFVALTAWRTHVIQTYNGVASSTIFSPPNGYTTYIDGVECRSLDVAFIGGSGFTSHTLEVRPQAFFAPASIGEASALQFPQTVWAVSLGTLINGQSAGHLVFNQPPNSSADCPQQFPPYNYVVPTVYTTAALVCSKESSEIEVISYAGAVRQVKGWQGLADIVPIDTTSTFAYEIRFYKPEDVGARDPEADPTSPYPVSGTPFVKYRIEPATVDYTPATEDNGEYYTLSGLKITKTFGSRTEVTALTPITDGWRLAFNNSARVEERTGNFYDDPEAPDGHPYQLDVIKNSTGTVIRSTKRYYESVAAGSLAGSWQGMPRLAKKVDGPDTSCPITTTLGYEGAYTGVIGGPSFTVTNPAFYGRATSMTCSDGRFKRYDYYTDNDRAGQFKREVGPICDAPTSVSGLAPDTSSSRTATVDWGADWTGRKVLPSSITQNVPARRFDAGIATSATANSQPLNSISVSQYFDSTNYQTVATKTYRRHLWNTVYVDLPYSSTWPDGKRQTAAYHWGDFNETTHAFTLDSSGLAWRETMLFGFSSNVDSSAALVTTVDSATVDTIWLVPNRSTKAVTYRNTKANVVRTEHWVFTGMTDDTPNFELLDWTNYTYDAASHPTGTMSSNGAQTSAAWTDGRKTSEIDESGTETTYTYDDLNRVLTKTKSGVTPSGFPTQASITTTYTYDAAGNVTKQKLTNGASSLSVETNYVYDLAGRLTQTTEPGSVVTNYSYSNGGRTVTKTYADSGTEITDHYLDGRVKSITGTAVVAKYYTYDGATETIHYGSDTSDRTSFKTRDQLGRVSSERAVNAPASTTYTFNTLGQLTTAQQSGSRPPMLTTYNSFGEAYQNGIDSDGDGTINNGTETSVSFVKESSDWWQVQTQKVYGTSIVKSTTKTRLTGFATNILSEVRTIDIHGNTTTKVVDVNRSTKTVINRTTYPDSSTNEEVTVINGLEVRRLTKENLAFDTKHDDLGRKNQTKDPRQTNWTVITYQTGTSWIATITDPASNVTTRHYDSMGRMDWEKNAANKYTYYAYTTRGETYRVWGDVPNPVEYAYDVSVVADAS